VYKSFEPLTNTLEVCALLANVNNVFLKFTVFQVALFVIFAAGTSTPLASEIILVF
jgi:hypothetical protein